MTETLLTIVGILVGAVVVYFIQQRRNNALASNNASLSSSLAVKTNQVETLVSQMDNDRQLHENQLLAEREAHDKQMESLNSQFNTRMAELNARREQEVGLLNTRLEQELAQLDSRRKEEVEQLNGRRQQELREAAERYEREKMDTAQRYEREKTEAAQRFDRQLRESLALVQEQLKTATEQLLRQRSRELDESNQTQMGALITPLRQTISEMRKAMDDNRDTYNRNTATLTEQLRQMHEATQHIGVEADRLARALQSGPKVQGNFGEMKLDLLLERFGFTRGEEYDLQQMIRDEYGNPVRNEDTNERMVPDVILHYPDHKDVIIDSKVSLTAFVNYVNAKDDDERHRAMAEHIGSIRKHVEELSRKDYSRYLNKQRVTLDYVIMFVPQESALLLALTGDTNLWSEAFDKKVFITGEQNLFAVLRMLQIAWTQQRQTENQEKVFGLANDLLDRVGDFMKRFEDVGDKISRVQQSYDNARKRLDGRQSMLVPANELKKLGAKQNPSRPIPEISADGLPDVEDEDLQIETEPGDE